MVSGLICSYSGSLHHPPLPPVPLSAYPTPESSEVEELTASSARASLEGAWPMGTRTFSCCLPEPAGHPLLGGELPHSADGIPPKNRPSLGCQFLGPFDRTHGMASEIGLRRNPPRQGKA
jgi:hypothetical protein